MAGVGFAQSRIERPIAAARVMLACASLFALWLDPGERYIGPTYALHTIYVAYAVIVAAILWPRRTVSGRLPLATLVIDIAASAVFQYLTLGPSSPFFVYFTFALFSAALRWDWRATIRTAIVVTVAYIVIALLMSLTLGPAELELNRFVIRFVYLTVVAMLLVYLGQHEARLRKEIQRLARWPVAVVGEKITSVSTLLEHAATVLGARDVLLVWDANEEPWMFVASWSNGRFAQERVAPDLYAPIVPEALAASTFICPDLSAADALSTGTEASRAVSWRGLPLHPGLAARMRGPGLVSAPFTTDRVTGRVFFTTGVSISPEIVPLVEVVGREIGASLDQRHSYDRARELAIAEERIRLARDLHDGVLQSLTGIRLELQSMAAPGARQAPTPDRLLALERALASEQQELRGFIEDLRPAPARTSDDSGLAGRLEAMRQRLADEWRTAVTMRIGDLPSDLSDPLEHALPLMVHEAIVNALKHGRPSSVAVDVHADEEALHVTVADDGHGFPTPGRFTHDALVRSGAGPASLRDRAAALGGQIAIESSTAGARVELTLPHRVTHG